MKKLILISTIVLLAIVLGVMTLVFIISKNNNDPSGTIPEGATPQGIVEDFLIEKGCIYENRNWDCTETYISETYGCKTIAKVDSSYGAGILTQLYSCAKPFKEGIYPIGCLYNQGITYLTFSGSEFIEIEDVETLASLFGDEIDTPSKAVLYTALATNSQLWKSIEIPTDAKMLVERFSIYTSRAIEVDGGYEVNLFGYRLCGCGDHPYYEIIYKVNRKGEIEEISTRDLYIPAGSEGLCID